MKRLTWFGIVAAAGLVLVAGARAASPPAASDRAAQTKFVSQAGEVKVCQVQCRLRCWAAFKRRRCRPGIKCRWRVPVNWRCSSMRGLCHPQFRTRIIWTSCSRSGVCSVKYRMCRCQ